MLNLTSSLKIGKFELWPVVQLFFRSLASQSDFLIRSLASGSIRSPASEPIRSLSTFPIFSLMKINARLSSLTQVDQRQTFDNILLDLQVTICTMWFGKEEMGPW